MKPKMSDPWTLPIALAAMLADPLLQYRYVRHIENLIGLAAKELDRTRWQPDYYALAQMYYQRFTRCREVFVNQYGNNLLNGFRRFFQTGKLELITCGATHGFLPLMTLNWNAVRAQIGERVGQIPEQGQHVLDFVRVEESESLVDVRRQATTLEGCFELAMAFARAKEDRDVARFYRTPHA